LPAGSAASAVTYLPIIPTFVLPYKRYDNSTLVHLSRCNAEQDQQSYRQTVHDRKLPFGYRAPAANDNSEQRALHHMTVWRMLSWMGGQFAALASGRQMLLEHNAASTCHRFVGALAPRKFRSPQRQFTLQHARQLLALITEWEQTFPEKFFPRFATRAGFG
jgi:hypothetical protein